MPIITLASKKFSTKKLIYKPRTTYDSSLIAKTVEMLCPSQSLKVINQMKAKTQNIAGSFRRSLSGRIVAFVYVKII